MVIRAEFNTDVFPSVDVHMRDKMHCCKGHLYMATGQIPKCRVKPMACIGVGANQYMFAGGRCSLFLIIDSTHSSIYSRQTVLQLKKAPDIVTSTKELQVFGQNLDPKWKSLY